MKLKYLLAALFLLISNLVYANTFNSVKIYNELEIPVQATVNNNKYNIESNGFQTYQFTDDSYLNVSMPSQPSNPQSSYISILDMRNDKTRYNNNSNLVLFTNTYNIDQYMCYAIFDDNQNRDLIILISGDLVDMSFGFNEIFTNLGSVNYNNLHVSSFIDSNNDLYRACLAYHNKYPDLAIHKK